MADSYNRKRVNEMTNQIIEQLKSLKSHCEDFMDEEGSVWAKDVEALDRAIEALGKQAIKQATSEWIPVSERLPENDGLVLVTVSGVHNNIIFDHALELGSYDQEEGWIIEMWLEWVNPQVTAWMPLPKAYRGKTK